MSGFVTYNAPADESVLVGYKGQKNVVDSAYFFCPYIPGMSQEARDEVTRALRSSLITPTPIQKLIMEVVRNGTAQVS